MEFRKSRLFLFSSDFLIFLSNNKFLIGSTGRPVKRFASSVTPSELVDHINEQLYFGFE